MSKIKDWSFPFLSQWLTVVEHVNVSHAPFSSPRVKQSEDIKVPNYSLYYVYCSSTNSHRRDYDITAGAGQYHAVVYN